MIGRVKGTQDFLDLSLWNFIIEQTKKHVTLYHFSEIATPIIEPLDLFKRSLGMYTDVVNKEMFVINTGDEEEKICLRPEITASTVRAFVENHVQQTPWKVFSYGSMFRYERPQKGRYREFHQFNLEIIGSASIMQDVQCIKMLDRLFHEQFHLNNYALLINFIGCFDDRKTYIELLQDYLDSPKGAEICQNCVSRRERNILRIFDCKNPICRGVYQEAPVITDSLCTSCNQEWQQLQQQLQLLSVSFIHQPTLVRGLDYYNKTVFEFVSDNLGAQNAFCGGGRYDQLVTQIGGQPDQPSIGAAIGLERLLLLLEPLRDKLPLPELPALHVVLPMDSAYVPLALQIADMLQAHNLCTDVMVEGDSLKSMMRHANKMGATYVLILGQEEQETKTVTVKHMTTGTEARIPQIELITYLNR